MWSRTLMIPAGVLVHRARTRPQCQYLCFVSGSGWSVGTTGTLCVDSTFYKAVHQALHPGHQHHTKKQNTSPPSLTGGECDHPLIRGGHDAPQHSSLAPIKPRSVPDQHHTVYLESTSPPFPTGGEWDHPPHDVQHLQSKKRTLLACIPLYTSRVKSRPDKHTCSV